MKKAELKELYQMMFPEYPDIVTVAQLQKMLGISRHVAYDLLTDREICAIKATPHNCGVGTRLIFYATNAS